METATTIEAGTASPSATITTARAALRNHWPEYLIEAAALAAFMISACVFSVLIEHPGSPLRELIDDPVARRALMGIAMGCTAASIVYSQWGQRSGAHMNPAISLTFLTLGKIERLDAIFYVASQFVGGITGVVIAEILIGAPLSHTAVNYAATVPGPGGVAVAFWAEAVISFLMMTTILVVSNTKGLTRFTGLFAAALVATFITIEAPFSGMSMNPARTLGSALPPGEWTALWAYFAAPSLGMLAAGFAYRIRHGAHRVFCAKLHHDNHQRCIFRCNYGAMDGN